MSESPVLIAIAGGSGCGKTYLAKQIRREAGEDKVELISMDQYFRSENGRNPSTINFDHPAHLDIDHLAEQLKVLKAGRAVSVPSYDFRTATQTRSARTVEAKPVILVEGLFVLADPLCKLFDLSIFLDVQPDQRLLGRLLRDSQERGATILEVVDRYQRFVRPSYQIFVAPTMQNADVVVDFTYRRAFFAQLLIHIIRDYVKGSAEMQTLIETVRKDTYQLGFDTEEGWMPLTTDIFKLAAAYPETSYPSPHLTPTDSP